ncbi:SPOR domain-containing protein [Novosphingobium sp. ZN18A2]|uniref:septal ring lytic transglycosylase RlpA family protein n=1 Tax=Novosphingobium sp. ZN18A2 TaxID=3079861 RepID=UPI0030D5F0CB
MPSANRPYPIVSIAIAILAAAVPASGAIAAPAQAGSPGATGPAADYPVVIGDPYVIDGKTFTPADTMNYDAVGYAIEDDQGATVDAAHRTLPLPSYVEVTSLESGRTILVRVTRRGPMHGDVVLGLSAGAWKQLGLSNAEKAAIRVRRVNPPEAERAMLRLGKTAPERMETPPGLLKVLRRRLGDSGGAILSGPAQPAPKSAATSATAASAPVPVSAGNPPVPTAPQGKSLSPAAKADVSAEKANPARAGKVSRAQAPALKPAPAVKPEGDSPKQKSPGDEGQSKSEKVAETPSAKAPGTKPDSSPSVEKAMHRWTVQVATMSTEARAKVVAAKVNGSVSPAGKYWRVRMGPFTTRDKADAALAKARSAGYADARVLTER